MDVKRLHELRKQLESLLQVNPSNDSLKASLRYLDNIGDDLSLDQLKEKSSTWLALLSELLNLRRQHIWGSEDRDEEQKRILDSIRETVETGFNATEDGPRLSILTPSTDASPLSVQIQLPQELLSNVNETFHLHRLATNPSKYLPPDKSLLSIISARPKSSGKDTESSAQKEKRRSIQKQVTEVATRAFWDEAYESLSSPTPSMQLSRIRPLYTDLHTAVQPLIPASYPIMDTLSDPLSPTSAPLVSAAGHLRELIAVLRQRCAPIRDAELDEIRERLDNAPSKELPRTIVDTARDLLEVAERMREDLTDFVLGKWTENDAHRWVRRKAMDMEHWVIFEMFAPGTIEKSYREWLQVDATNSLKPLVSRLVKALSSPSPVSPFPPSDNLLPPPLMFSAHDLLKLQNSLQALAIVASLRSLIRPTATEFPWLSRVWTLLELEAEKDVWEDADTKLINLEDELVQAAGLTGNPEAENRLREAVQHTLRKDSPVFLLLLSRLSTALQSRLTEEPGQPPQVPTQLRSGRKPVINITKNDEEPEERELLIKGFEDPILKEGIKNVVKKTRQAIAWIEECWGRFLDNV